MGNPSRLKLYFTHTSPFARKVRILAIEQGSLEQLELIECNPFESPEVLAQVNPIGRVPVLVLPDGMSLADSSVICEYLCAQFSGPKKFLGDSQLKWQVLKNQSLADGILDCAVNVVLEKRRPKELCSQSHIQDQFYDIKNALGYFDQHVGELSISEPNLGAIALGCALGYLDFRIPELLWRESYLGLVAGFDKLSQRDSFLKTLPRERP